MNRLVLASLNQGARVLGVLERRCRDHLLQRTDVQVAAAARAAGWFDFPDGPYDSRYDYGLTDFEEENECHEPQEMPDELWPGPMLDHLGRPAGYYYTMDPWYAKRHYYFPAHPSEGQSHTAPDGGQWIFTDYGKRGGASRWEATNYPPSGDPYQAVKAREKAASSVTLGAMQDMGANAAAAAEMFPQYTKTSAPVAIPRVATDDAGASPGGATHPAPPGEREPTVSEFVDVMREHRLWAVDGKPAGHMCQCGWTSDYPVSDHKEHLARRLVAALYPMQPQEKP